MHTSAIHAALACTVVASPLLTTNAARASVGFTLRASDFANGGPIPLAHAGPVTTCPGQLGLGIAPALRWSGAPHGTRSFALEVVDPDARVPRPGFVHWVAYNILSTRTGLGPTTAKTYTQGTNGASSRGYIGPCPPAGDPPHHYHFTLFALNTPRLAGTALNDAQLRTAIKGHVLGAAHLVGTFKRPNS